LSWRTTGARDNTRAAYVYLVMASFGTLALLLAFGLLSGPDGGYAFEAIRASSHTPMIAAFTLGLMLLGGRIKGRARAASCLAAARPPRRAEPRLGLMSGVMTKVAIYGFIRVVFDLLGEPTWGGRHRASLGGVTAVLGILHAVMRATSSVFSPTARSKISESYSSASASRSPSGRTAWGGRAALALTAALFHVLNHSFFKSLLFFGAGAVLTATGERDMERLGASFIACRSPASPFSSAAWRSRRCHP